MNILIDTFHSPYTGERVGGAETSLKLIAEEFAKRGHKVTFFSRSFTKTWSGFRKKSENEVEVYIFTKFKIGLLNSYKFKQISRFFKNKFIKSKLSKIDIVHTYNNIGIVSFYVNFKPDFNFKLVVRMAGLKLFEDFESNPELISVYEHYFKSIDLYNFISEGLRELVLEKSMQFNLKVNFEPYFVKDIGIDLSTLPQKKIRFKSDNEPFKIVMASRFSKYQKRQDILIDAMKLLKEMNIELTLIGEGPNKKLLRNKVQKFSLEKQVCFRPFQSSIWSDLVEYDLLVHACNYEGLSKIIIESMGAGLPVLVSNVPPLNDYIKEGCNGFLVDNEPAKWAGKILYVYNNQNQLDLISKNSIDFVNQNYSSSINIGTYESIFKELISSASHG
ncbi:glycosyltransferase [Psychroflexus montanilacus]|uniref:glycosyltransferase n=1 Tax=Psychroflexus montanilacus TaxID=2873598 RepID=UPI001CCF802A|nr:glycosyltransferase [Psychroflexus montanilacus]MBZ9652108.1 glycosyltransferase [Psychroflexus montanilacus]